MCPALLGFWLDNIFPFAVEEMCGSLNIEKRPNLHTYNMETTIDVPFEPFTLEKQHVLPAAKEELYSSIDSFEDRHNAMLGSLTLHPSSSKRHHGGVCGADVSLRASFMRYFREHFVSMLRNTGRNDHDLMNAAVQSYNGQTSNYWRRGIQLDHLIGFKPAIMARACLSEDAWKSYDAGSIEKVLVRLENLGHASAEYVEGLNIELLDFQKETLQWALEREQVPGGIQSFLWPKLPSCVGKEELYYNPLLRKFRKDKPRLVRGGFIASQMGLGKTVISLALILQNSAPKLPASGSHVSSLDNAPSSGSGSTASSTGGWDKELYKKTSTESQKRGSILSRGTLVIVS
jgi:SNF2-related domain